MNYDVIVLGSGPAGFEAARKVATEGRRTALVTVTPAGGRTTVGSLLPSKVWLYAAHRESAAPVDAQAVAAAVQSRIEARVKYTAGVLRDAGVELIMGTGTITAPGRVTVTSEDRSFDLEADSIVIATGSEPTFSPGVRPDGQRVIAPRHTKMLTRIPKSLIMVGGGITGVEYAEAFARLGSSVTMISSGPILPRFHHPYVRRLNDHLKEIGVRIETGHRVTSVEVSDGADGTDSDRSDEAVRVITENGNEYRAEMAFIATGRAADLTVVASAELRSRLTDDGGRFVPVDALGRTAVEGMYACGDATGPPFTANRAVWQGRQVATAILGNGNASTDGTGTPALIEAIFTDPQLAQIGTTDATEGDAREYRRSWAVSMLDTIHHHRPDGTTGQPGELTVWTNPDGTIHGAAAFGEGAAEVLAPIQVAMNNGISWNDLNAVPLGYPTLSEIVTG